jgi:hypothetical protein
MIRRFAFRLYTGRGEKLSGRDWARQLGISPPWIQKLVLGFQTDPTEMYREL